MFIFNGKTRCFYGAFTEFALHCCLHRIFKNRQVYIESAFSQLYCLKFLFISVIFFWEKTKENVSVIHLNKFVYPALKFMVYLYKNYLLLEQSVLL